MLWIGGRKIDAHKSAYELAFFFFFKMVNCFDYVVCVGERNMDSYKSSYKLPKKHGEEQLSDSDIAVNIDLEIEGDGEYVLKIKKMNLSSTNEDDVERAKRMAQNGAMLLLYGEMLQDMGEKMIAQSQALVYSVFKMRTPPKSKSDR